MYTYTFESYAYAIEKPHRSSQLILQHPLIFRWPFRKRSLVQGTSTNACISTRSWALRRGDQKQKLQGFR